MSNFEPELTETFNYDDLQKHVGRNNLSFSIFESLDDDGPDDKEWMVKAPDVLSEKPVFEGDVEFYSKYWRICDQIEDRNVESVSEFCENPTWKNIVDIASKMVGSDYLFLEGFRNLKKTETGIRIEFVFGS